MADSVVVTIDGSVFTTDEIVTDRVSDDGLGRPSLLTADTFTSNFTSGGISAMVAVL